MKLTLRPHGLPGKLIVLCGVDGAGKTTLEERLCSALRQRHQRTYQPSDWWRRDTRVRRSIYGEPGGPAIPDEAIAMFSIADRLAHQAREIVPCLERGEWVICNRYVFTVFAFFAARASIDLAWLADAARLILAPDIGFFLDAPAEAIVRRVAARDGAHDQRFDQNPAFVARFNDAFRTMATDNGLTVLRGDAAPAAVLSDTLTALAARGFVIAPGAAPSAVSAD